MARMQEFIEFTFHEVWCKADDTQMFCSELFAADPAIKALIQKYESGKSAYQKSFYRRLRDIYDAFTSLSTDEVEYLRSAFVNNNAIEKACSDLSVETKTYSDIEAVDIDLAKCLRELFGALYSDDLNNKLIRSYAGNMDDHYEAIMSENPLDLCPFCGLSDLKNKNQRKRDALDHYLPKGLYPFNSVNLGNLVPICNSCNSSYKLQKDPLGIISQAPASHHRLKIFYPYSASVFSLQINVEINLNKIRHRDKLNFVTEEIDIIPDSKIYGEEIEAWLKIFEIDERYKAKICSSGGGKDWLDEALFHCQRDKTQYGGLFSLDNYFEAQREFYKLFPYANLRFLKFPFLEACRVSGFFSSIETI